MDENASIKLLKITERKIGRYSRYSVLVKTDTNSFSKMMERGKLSIGWDRCRVFEYVQITRCFKCLGFNHHANNCTKSIICSNCSGNHDVKQCKSSEIKCVNCVWAHDQLKLRVNYNHNAFSNECHVFKKQIEQQHFEQIEQIVPIAKNVYFQ